MKVFRENEKIAEATEEAKEQHYEVPTDFFKLSLGKWLKYSSCYFPEGCTDLTQAEEAMLEKICARAQVGKPFVRGYREPFLSEVIIGRKLLEPKPWIVKFLMVKSQISKSQIRQN